MELKETRANGHGAKPIGPDVVKRIVNSATKAHEKAILEAANTRFAKIMLVVVVVGICIGYALGRLW